MRFGLLTALLACLWAWRERENRRVQEEDARRMVAYGVLPPEAAGWAVECLGTRHFFGDHYTASLRADPLNEGAFAEEMARICGAERVDVLEPTALRREGKGAACEPELEAPLGGSLRACCGRREAYREEIGRFSCDVCLIASPSGERWFDIWFD